MSNNQFHIPRHGGAGPSLLGVEFKDTYILIVSIFVGIGVGRLFGAMFYLGIPFVGYHVNKQYLEWKSRSLPGFFRTFLFEIGLWGYSKAFRSQKVVFIGDDRAITPGNKRVLLESDKKE
ncbi:MULTISPECIES: hypothetical protein [Paraburkholderia]|uniref:Uncharacterized protein n=1 Tax=Paraburkholderia madseniana TaxID=2599607 RepID=A0AAP5F0W8_9BURK|nr:MULTISPECIES: hypothetical protein [Paraburkholderia]MCX4151038.1 hypothetical protein [Paraburkholderia madseniana]MCX4176678.1 hypothetical protein [Paraburkholderia madseniana]MDN7153970.1 hypothetical protein [Paraburkholderia sp. WS6]MDQ6412852.1 hypothetical protein [Paraburkholderia madseniana]MDQ6464669.1 hypothetical protein [Paraburkholderia madseniana]